MKEVFPGTKKEGPPLIEVSTFDEAVERAESHFRELLTEKFPESEFDFHNVSHSADVREHARDFLETVRKVDPQLLVDEAEVLFGEGAVGLDDKAIVEQYLGFLDLVAWAHDVEQRYAKNIAAAEGRRVRLRGFTRKDIEELPKSLQEQYIQEGIPLGNERASADALIEELGRYRYVYGGRVFPEDSERVAHYIGVTFPKFEFAEIPGGGGTKGLKVFQPYLTKESPIGALAVAQADLRGALWAEDFEVFRGSGNAEFRELYIGIKNEIAQGVEAISQGRRAEIAKVILEWIRSQIGFAKWQRHLFTEALEKNDYIKRSLKREHLQALLEETYGKAMEENSAKAESRHRALFEKLDQRYRLGENSAEWTEKCASITDEDFRMLLKEIGYRSE